MAPSPSSSLHIFPGYKGVYEKQQKLLMTSTATLTQSACLDFDNKALRYVMSVRIERLRSAAI